MADAKLFTIHEILDALIDVSNAINEVQEAYTNAYDTEEDVNKREFLAGAAFAFREVQEPINIIGEHFTLQHLAHSTEGVSNEV